MVLRSTWDAPNLDVILASDLHIGVHAAPAATAQAFAAVLEWANASGATHAVLLGDTFDIDIVETDNGSIAQAVEKLSRINSKNRWFGEAVDSFSARGGSVTLVPGNHDAILRMFPARVPDRVAARLPQASIEPWSVYVDGLMYAEHGHQLHDLQAFAAWLAQEEIPSPLPIGALLDKRRGGRITTARCLRLALRHLAWRGSAAASGLHASYEKGPLADFSDTHQIPADIVRVADRLPRSTGARMALDLARRRLMPADRALPRSTYLLAAAEELAAAAQTGGARLPFVVFGHSHEPVIRDLQSTTYLNTGWWPPDGGHFVRVSREGSQVRAWLLRSERGRAPMVEGSRSVTL